MVDREKTITQEMNEEQEEMALHAFLDHYDVDLREGLVKAAELRNPAMCLLIVNRLGERLDEELKNEALIQAVSNGDEQCTEVLLSYARANPSLNKDGKNSLFQYSILCGHLGVAKLLALLGAEIGVTKENGAAVIASAAADGALLRILKDAGVDLDMLGQSGSAMHLAAMGGNRWAIHNLISAGANPNVADRNKVTPMHLVIENGDALALRILLVNNANVNAEDIEGITPLQLARVLADLGGKPKMLKVIQEELDARPGPAPENAETKELVRPTSHSR